MRRRGPVLAAAVLIAACAATARQAAQPSNAIAAAPDRPDRSRAPPRGPPPVLQVPEQRHFRLSNGLAVRFVEQRRLPIVALDLVIDAGAVHDPRDRPGLASLTAAMVTEGTKSRTATQISDELGFIGAHLAASAGFDSATVAGSALSRHLEELLEILGDVVANPTFPHADFARVQDQRLVALVQQRDSPGAVALKAFAGLFWPGHPYGHWPMGTEASVKAMRSAELARFHTARWRPGSAELVAVGDVGEEALRRALERTLGGWPAGDRPAEPATVGTTHARQAVLVEKPGAPQAFVLLGMPGLERSNPDYYAAEVAFQILGGGASSRLFRELREKLGYTYGMDARNEARKLGGASVIAGSVKTDVAGAAMRSLFQQIRALREVPVTPEELADAKGSLVLSLPSDFVTVAGIASRLAEEVTYGLPDDYWNRYAAEIGSVSAADVQRVAQKVLDPAKLTTVMVTEPNLVRPQLDGLPLGPIEVVKEHQLGVY